MSGCRNNKIKCNCGTHQNARCVYYDAYLPKYSKLDEDCVNINETTEELYENQEKILDSIDLTLYNKVRGKNIKFLLGYFIIIIKYKNIFFSFVNF